MFWVGLLSSLVAVLRCDDYNVSKNPLLPPVKVIFNSSDAQMKNFVCLLEKMSNVVGHFETEEVPCVQLLQLPAEPWELHVLLLRAEVSSPLCEPRVYGPLPSVLQVRFALLDEDSLGSLNVVSLQLNSRAGHLLIDLDLDSEQKVLPLALKNLFEVVETVPLNRSRQAVSRGFQLFQRIAELDANPIMTKQIEESRRRRKEAHSLPMYYVSAALTMPLLIFAFTVGYSLLWDEQPVEDKTQEMETSQETMSEGEVTRSETTMRTKEKTTKSETAIRRVVATRTEAEPLLKDSSKNSGSTSTF